jgi:hypothetical protein
MNTISYSTGRDYGTAQILVISFKPTEDLIADVLASFVDTARGISGTVTVLGFDTLPGAIGAAVLREYDAGRYTLA